MLSITPFARTFAARSIVIWSALRACMAGVAILAAALARRPPPERPFLLHPAAAILVIGMVGAIGELYSRVANEDIFISNLGYGRSRVFYLLLVPVALEILAFLVLRS
jgi:hypothetical protein